MYLIDTQLICLVLLFTIDKRQLFVPKLNKKLDKPTCESMPLLMINFLRACSSAGVGFRSVDLGVGTGFRFVAGDPGVTAAPGTVFVSWPFMSKLYSKSL